MAGLLSIGRRDGDHLMRKILLTLPLLLGVGMGQAQEPPAGAPGTPLDAPTVTPSPITGEAVEPEITIIESGDRVIYEYRIRGHLYMIKIQPQIGPPYYLLDTDGDGVLDKQDNSPTNIAIPQWILFEWK
jgi:hypothetical protein